MSKKQDSDEHSVEYVVNHHPGVLLILGQTRLGDPESPCSTEHNEHPDAQDEEDKPDE